MGFRAIDVHAHLSTKPWNVTFSKLNAAMEKYYGFKTKELTEKEMAEEFIEAGVKGILIGMDAESNLGTPRVPNDYVAKLAKDYPDAFIGSFVCVDPWKGEMAIQEIDHCIRNLGMMGVKFQGIAQAFFPSDRRFYPIYEKCLELKVPVQFHMGTTGLGAGMPGGMRSHLKYTQPIPYLDDLAADFPDLTIIGCHYAWPWQNEMIAVLLHKANVYNELSGWSPKYFTPEFKKEVNGRLQDKFMFGSDYPVLSHARLIADWEQSGFKPEVLEKVFYKNAQRILNLKV